MAQERAADPDAEFDAHLSWTLVYIHTPEFRGCPFLNTTAEVADPTHPSGQVVRETKARLRKELVGSASASTPATQRRSPDRLQLAIEGAFAISPVFGDEGPTTSWS